MPFAHVVGLVLAMQPSMEGRLAADGGLSIHYRHAFNRNAITDARQVENHLIAVTPGGLLLRFRLPSVELVDVVYPDAPVVRMGTDADGAPVVGDARGDLFRVDAESMALTRVGHVESPLLWLGGYRASPSSSSSLVAMVASDFKIEIHDLGSGRQWTPELSVGRVTGFIDRASRLWLGSDKGEWGGWVGRVDLPSGALHLYDACLTPSEDDPSRPNAFSFQCSGVYGFTQLRDGRVWMHGGMMHMGATRAVIAQLTEDALVPMFRNQSFNSSSNVPDKEPRLPITHVLEHPDRGDITVFSYGEVFRTDARLTRWQRRHELRLLYRFGRPDAVGSYPSVTAVDWAPDGKGLLVSTALDGMLLLEEGGERRHAFAGDLGALSIRRMERAREGIVFFDDESVWTQSAGEWTERRLEPRTRPRFGIESLDEFGQWQTDFAFVDPEGYLVAVAETNIRPGPRATVRWRADEPEILATETDGDGYLSGGFATPDGTLWALSGRGLFRLGPSGWKHTATFPAEEDMWRPDVHVLGGAAPPWLLLEKTTGSLASLTPSGDTVLVRSVRHQGGDLHDAVRWGNGWLFATSRGLRLYDADRNRWSASRLDLQDGSVRVLGRDDAGRLWLGGVGLWLLDEKKRLIDLAAIPALRGRDVVAIIADPHRRSGVIVSLGARGLLYVATEP